jgi:hypothetical protein
MLPVTRPQPQENPQVSYLCPVLEPHRLATTFNIPLEPELQAIVPPLGLLELPPEDGH